MEAKMSNAHIMAKTLDCWVDFLVCPRRYLAVLPAHARANLFSGD